MKCERGAKSICAVKRRGVWTKCKSLLYGTCCARWGKKVTGSQQASGQIMKCDVARFLETALFPPQMWRRELSLTSWPAATSVSSTFWLWQKTVYPQLNVYLLALSQNKAAHTQNYFFVYIRERDRPVGIRPQSTSEQMGEKWRELVREREEKRKASASSTLFFSPHCENTSARFYIFWARVSPLPLSLSTCVFRINNVKQG